MTLALTLLGFLLSTLFAAATLKVTEDYEYVVATELLRGQAEDYGLRLANGLPAQLPRTQRLSGYTRADVPPLLVGAAADGLGPTCGAVAQPSASVASAQSAGKVRMMVGSSGRA